MTDVIKAFANRLACALATTFLLASPEALADASPASATFFEAHPPRKNLPECASTEVTALRFLRVASASLFAQQCPNNGRALTPPLSLYFTYQRTVPGDAFTRSATAMLERNLDSVLFQHLRDRFNQFNRQYRDTAPGDRYQLDYLEGGQLVLSFNDRVIARENGHDFARAYFSIWFGEQPYSAPLKAALLSGSATAR